MLNSVVLIGRLTRDPELTYTPNGTAVCKFTLAVTRKFNKAETDFINIVVWRAAAEACATYLTKGSLAAVDGRLQIRPYRNQEGNQRKVAEVIADDVRFLDSKARGGSAPARSDHDDWAGVGTEVDINDYVDDIPF